LAKLTEYENPVTGKKDNLFDLSGIWGKILGVVMFFIVFAAGQNIASMIGNKLPLIDTKIEPITTTPATTGGTKQVLKRTL
jgi:hypothetical protein